MFKVSFKDDFKKTEVFNARVTVVTLTGRCLTPDWFKTIPCEIDEWVRLHPSVDVDEMWNMKGNLDMIIKVSGKAKCAAGEVFDPVLGERIAESRAKIKLYKFVCTLCKKLQFYYVSLAFGNAEIGRIVESHNVPQLDCLWLTLKKYRSLMIMESHHLGELLEQA